MNVDKAAPAALRRLQHIARRLAISQLLGTYRSMFKGQGLEFSEVRPYEEGDDVRYIDWNVTARFQQPYIKSYREERDLTVVFGVDTSASMLFGSGDTSKRDIAGQALSLLAAAAIANRDRVALVLGSDKVEHYLPPRKGLSHGRRFTELIGAVPLSQKRFNLKAMLHFIDKVHKRSAVCILCSDWLFEPKKNAQLLAAMAQRHELIAWRILDPLEKDLPAVDGAVQLRDLETGKMVLVDVSAQNSFQKEQLRLIKEWEECFRRRRIGLMEMTTRNQPLNILLEYFNRGKRV